MIRLLRALSALALLIAAPAPALAQSMQFSSPVSNRSIVLGQSAVAVPHTGDTTETTLATITIPAGAMGVNGRVVVEALFSYTNNSNTKTPKVRFGGTAFASANVTTTAAAPMRSVIANRGAANSQIGNSSTGYIATAAANVASAIDTTASVDVTITGQLGTSTDTITLESYQVILYPKG